MTLMTRHHHPMRVQLQEQGPAAAAPTRSNSRQLEVMGATSEEDPLKSARLVSDLSGGHPSISGDALAVANAAGVEEASLAKAYWTNDAFDQMNDDWSLGFTLSEGELGVGLPGELTPEEEAAIQKDAQVDSVKDYQHMVMRDFNFQSAVTGIAGPPPRDKSPAGLQAWRDEHVDAFVGAAVKRFAPDAAGDSQSVADIAAIARNLWSYATTGADYSGTTDIAQMQGLLYVFDKEIQGSSNTNTKMENGREADDFFVVPGTEDWDTPIKLLKGDGRHGRATILTTRHLLADVQSPTLEGYDTTHLLIDKSGSMQRDDFQRLAKLIDMGIVSGDIALAGYDDAAASLAKVEGGRPLDPDEAARILQVTGDAALERGAGRDDIQNHDPRASQELGNASGMGNQEQGISAALSWVADPSFAVGTGRTQLVITTDEADASSPEDLVALQELCLAKGVDVKVVFFQSGGAQTDRVDGGDTQRFVVLDLADLGKTAFRDSQDRLRFDQLAAARPGSRSQSISELGQ